MRSDRDSFAQPELPLSPATNRRARILASEDAAKLAIARRGKPSMVPDHMRLVLTLELRHELAEQIAARDIKVGKNLERVILDLLEQGVTRWR